MAVQKSRKSPSKRGMKRAHSALAQPTLSTDRTSGEIHRRHHITKLGYLKGKKALQSDKFTS
jgi:large subunit ribosomal protein L32